MIQNSAVSVQLKTRPSKGLRWIICSGTAQNFNQARDTVKSRTTEPGLSSTKFCDSQNDLRSSIYSILHGSVAFSLTQIANWSFYGIDTPKCSGSMTMLAA